jgi:hypothetical protein
MRRTTTSRQEREREHKLYQQEHKVIFFFFFFNSHVTFFINPYKKIDHQSPKAREKILLSILRDPEEFLLPLLVALAPDFPTVP